MKNFKYYPSKFVMRDESPSSSRITDLWSFRSKKSNKRYIVEIEHFSNNIIGIKFYWKGVAESPNRYSLLTNDYEPRTIIMSCIRIILNYIEKNPLLSFGFVAASNFDSQLQENNINKRFRFYRRMMLSLFSPERFSHYSDKDNYIYLLINNFALESRKVSIEEIQEEISRIYIGDYHICID